MPSPQHALKHTAASWLRLPTVVPLILLHEDVASPTSVLDELDARTSSINSGFPLHLSTCSEGSPFSLRHFLSSTANQTQNSKFNTITHSIPSSNKQSRSRFNSSIQVSLYSFKFNRHQVSTPTQTAIPFQGGATLHPFSLFISFFYSFCSITQARQTADM